MIIAVASQNFRTVTAHAGKTRRFILFEAEQGKEPIEVGRLDLPMGMAFHDFHGDGPHPLDQAQVVLAASAGPGFIRRMSARGIAAAVSSESDPVEAVRQFLTGKTGQPNSEVSACGCGHGDGHAHGDGHTH